MRRYLPLGVKRTNDTGGFSSSMSVRPHVPLSASHILHRPGVRREKARRRRGFSARCGGDTAPRAQG